MQKCRSDYVCLSGVKLFRMCPGVLYAGGSQTKCDTGPNPANIARLTVFRSKHSLLTTDSVAELHRTSGKRPRTVTFP